MSQNPTSNKFSSIIGFLLLIGVIAFTVFINFFVEEPIEEIKEEAEIIEIEKPKFRVFDSTGLANFWKLEKLQTDSIKISYNKRRTYVKIDENLGTTTYNPLKSANFNKLDDSIKRYFEEAYKDFSSGEVIINYGILDFKNSYIKNSVTTFGDVEIKYLNTNSADSAKLMEIGNIFLEYQIESITTEPTYGDFTQIILKDGRKLFLIRKATKIQDDYNRKILGNAIYLNDSTRIIYPSHK